jgi:excisionase family DNA binding protein
MRTVQHMQSDLVSTTEAAEIIGTSASTVNRWASNGRLPVALQSPGPTGARFYKRTTVERVAAKYRAEALARLGLAS